MTIEEYLEQLKIAIQKEKDNDSSRWYDADYLDLIDAFKGYKSDSAKRGVEPL